MNAALMLSGRVPQRGKGGRHIVSKSPKNRKLRVVQWHIERPDDVRALWEGNEDSLLSGRDESFRSVTQMTRGTGLPLVFSQAGTIIEFQELIGEIWKPCLDPREGTVGAKSGQGHSNIYVFDSNRGWWSAYVNFFTYPRWRALFPTKRDQVEACLESIKLSDVDVVIVCRNTDHDEADYNFVRHLREKRGFVGRIYGLAEKPRWQSKFRNAGCTQVFTKAQMGKLLAALYG